VKAEGFRVQDKKMGTGGAIAVEAVGRWRVQGSGFRVQDKKMGTGGARLRLKQWAACCYSAAGSGRLNPFNLHSCS